MEDSNPKLTVLTVDQWQNISRPSTIRHQLKLSLQSLYTDLRMESIDSLATPTLRSLLGMSESNLIPFQRSETSNEG